MSSVVTRKRKAKTQLPIIHTYDSVLKKAKSLPKLALLAYMIAKNILVSSALTLTIDDLLSVIEFRVENGKPTITWNDVYEGVVKQTKVQEVVIYKWKNDIELKCEELGERLINSILPKLAKWHLGLYEDYTYANVVSFDSTGMFNDNLWNLSLARDENFRRSVQIEFRSAKAVCENNCKISKTNYRLQPVNEAFVDILVTIPFDLMETVDANAVFFSVFNVKTVSKQKTVLPPGIVSLILGYTRALLGK